MIGIGRFFNYANKMFSKSSAQIAKSAPKIEQKGTEVLTDLVSGTQTLKREITYAGKKATATVETRTLENGAKQTRLSIEGGGDNPIWRTRTVTREKGASIYGGDTIKVDTDYTKYWCYGKKSTLKKEYNPNGRLEHTELDYTYQAGNGLGYAKHRATQDRMYAEISPTHSVNKMLENPYDTKKVMHSLDNSTNYNRFQTNETPYAKALKEREAKTLTETTKTEKAKETAELAAKKAAAELEAKMPRVNTSKILGLNAKELKMVEKVHEDGSVTRYFFRPETGVGKRKPVIKTFDQGILHQEWISKNPKADMIYMKQVGNDTPYIIAKRGNYTELLGIQYYNDGANKLVRYGNTELSGATGTIQVFDKTAAERRRQFPSIANTIPDYPSVPVKNGSVCHDPYKDRYTNAELQAVNKIAELNKDAKNNFINVIDLIKDYKA